MANHFGLIMPSLLVMIAILSTGYTSSSEILATTLGSETVWQLITLFVLLYALSESGAERVLARWMISRKAFNGRPILFSGVFLAAITILAALVSALGSYLFGIALVDSIAATAGYEDKSQWKKAMITGVLVSSSIGSGILPFKGMALLIYNLMAVNLGEAGVMIDQSSYMISAAFTGLLVCLVYTLALKPLFRVDFSRLKSIDVAAICADGGISFNKRQLGASIVFLVGIIYALFPYLPESIPFYNSLSYIGQGFWFALAVVLLDVIRIEDEPILKIEQSMSKAVNWGVILGVCAFTSIGGMISNEELGIREWLTQLVNIAFGDVSFPIFVFILIFLTLLLTNVLSNVATSVIIGTLAGPFLIQYGLNMDINVSCIIPGIVMPALCAFLTMAAGGSAPLFLATDCMKDDPKWIWTYGLILFPLVALSSSASCLFCAYLLA